MRRFLQLFTAESFPLQDPVQQGVDQIRRFRLVPDIVQNLFIRILLRKGQPFDLLEDAAAAFLPFPFCLRTGSAQAVLKFLIRFRPEQLTEDLNAILRGRMQQLQKISLSDHTDLTELCETEAKNRFNGSVYVRRTVQNGSVGKKQCRFRLQRGSGICFPGPGIPKDPFHTVILSGIPEIKCDFGRRRQGDAFGMEHGNASEISAGFAVKRKRDGIEDGRFTGTGISGDQKQTVAGELFEVNDGLLQIGTESGHGQLLRSHRSTSQISSIRSVTMADCSSLIVMPFCAS